MLTATQIKPSIQVHGWPKINIQCAFTFVRILIILKIKIKLLIANLANTV